MSDPSDPRSWVEYAEQDYLLTRSILRRKKPFTGAACFHAQQSAGKYLKAILVAKKIYFPKSHDLILLSELCEEAGVLVPVEARLLHVLTDNAVLIRYPGVIPTLEDAHQALEIAIALRRFARQWLGLPPARVVR